MGTPPKKVPLILKNSHSSPCNIVCGVRFRIWGKVWDLGFSPQGVVLGLLLWWFCQRWDLETFVSQLRGMGHGSGVEFRVLGLIF